MKRSAMMSQPLAMRSKRYIGMGLAIVDGNAAWRLICACVDGDDALVRSLLDDDSNLANVQYWYQMPMHFAVREGHIGVVRDLLEQGNPTTSCYGGGEWGELLAIAELRDLTEITDLLRAEMSHRFGYSAAFASLAGAIRAYDADRVLQILADHPDLLAASDGSGNTAVHWAALAHQPSLIGELAARGADLDAKRADGKSAVLLALHGDYDFRWWRDVPAERRRTPQEMITALFDAGAARPFGLAVQAGDDKAIRRTLAEHPDAARTLDSARYSPLYYASLGAQPETTELLLAFDADPNKPESEAPRGRALYEAAAQNNLDQARMLLDACADPNAAVDSSGNCLYIVASRHPEQCAEMQALLHEHGAEPASWQMSADELREAVRSNRRFDDEETLWTDVLEKDDLELLDLLIERSPDVPASLDAWIFRPGAPAMVATQPALDRLIEHGFDIARGDWRGANLLHYCARFGSTEIARAALQRGAPIDAIELMHSGTPLGTAARCGKTDMARLLLENGADLTLPSEQPWAQPLARALRAGHAEIAELLSGDMEWARLPGLDSASRES